MTQNAPPKRILAIKLADIGDLLLITPALRALRDAYPAAALDALVTPRSASAFQGLALIDNLILFDKYPFDHPVQALRSGRWWEILHVARHLREGRYDTVILFHHLTLRFGALKHAALLLTTGARRRIGLDNGRGWFLTHRVPDPGYGAKHELEMWLDLAAAAGAPVDGHTARQIELGVSEADQRFAGELLPPTGRPRVALHPGSGGYSLARRWEMVKHAELGQRLAHEAQIVIVGTPADGTHRLATALGEQATDLGGCTSLAQLAAVLARCDLLVGADSGVLHVAAAAGTPTVALFGPTNYGAWAPPLPAEKLRVIRSGSACSPCAYVGHRLGTPNGCPERTCMSMITVDQVHQAAQALLGSGRPEHDRLILEPAATAPALQPDAEASPIDPPPIVRILGVPLHAVTYDDLLAWIGRLVHGNRARQIATVNPEFVMAARRDSIFRVVLERATLCLADGVGLLWAARWLYRRFGKRSPLPERVTGSDGVPLIAERAAREGWRLFSSALRPAWQSARPRFYRIAIPACRLPEPMPAALRPEKRTLSLAW